VLLRSTTATGVRIVAVGNIVPGVGSIVMSVVLCLTMRHGGGGEWEPYGSRLYLMAEQGSVANLVVSKVGLLKAGCCGLHVPEPKPCSLYGVVDRIPNSGSCSACRHGTLKATGEYVGYRSRVCCVGPLGVKDVGVGMVVDQHKHNGHRLLASVRTRRRLC
jgi:hypothetical protein